MDLPLDYQQNYFIFSAFKKKPWAASLLRLL